MSVTPQARVFREVRSILVESIWWDAAAGRLRWCDITQGTLHSARLDGLPDGSEDTVVTLPPPVAGFQPAAAQPAAAQPAAAQPTGDGGLVVALGDRVVRTDADGAITATVAAIAHRPPLGPSDAGLRLNETKCDPFGALVTGSMELGDVEPDSAAGAIYRVTPDGDCTVMLGGFGVANGFEWSDDGRTFYFTDTAVQTVFRVAYGPDGVTGEPEPFLVGRASDGLALDVDGCFWNGVYGEGRVVRWTPDGEVDLEIELPAPNVTSVAFGGPGLRTLFVGTARENLDEAALDEHPLSGSLFAIDTPTSGRPVGRFGPPAPEPTRRTA